MDPKPLNKIEIWIAENAVPVFAVLGVAVAFAAAGVFLTYQKQNDTADKVHVIAPQVTKINQAICDARALENEARARRCAERIRVGLINCRRYSRCRAAFLAALTYPPPARSSAPSSTELEPEGGGVQNPSDAGQPPSPGQRPGHRRRPQTRTPSPVPAPVPAPEPAPGHSGEAPGQTGGNPGQGGGEPPGQSGSNHGQQQKASGLGVELCALERTCVGVEVGVDPKGLLP